MFYWVYSSSLLGVTMSTLLETRLRKLDKSLKRLSIVFFFGNKQKDFDLIMEKVHLISCQIYLCRYQLDCILSTKASTQIAKSIKILAIVQEYYEKHQKRKKLMASLRNM